MSESTETIATEDPARAVADRPWAALAREREAEEGPWSDYSAWRTWLNLQVDAQATPGIEAFGQIMGGFDPGPPLDMLDDIHTEIALYVVMCKLADGEYSATGAPR